MIASSALKQWDPAEPGPRRQPEGARARRGGDASLLRSQRARTPRRAQFAVEAAYWARQDQARRAATRREASGGTTTKQAFERYRAGARRKPDGTSAALGSRQAGIRRRGGVHAARRRSSARASTTRPGHHRYAGTTVEVLDQYRKGAAEAQKSLRRSCNTSVDDYASPEWATAAIARQGSLYDSLRTGLYNTRPPALKMFDKKTEALLSRAENSDNLELQEQADARAHEGADGVARSA